MTYYRIVEMNGDTPTGWYCDTDTLAHADELMAMLHGFNPTWYYNLKLVETI